MVYIKRYWSLKQKQIYIEEKCGMRDTYCEDEWLSRRCFHRCPLLLFSLFVHLEKLELEKLELEIYSLPTISLTDTISSAQPSSWPSFEPSSDEPCSEAEASSS